MANNKISIAEVISQLEFFFPLKTAEVWDNVGLQLGKPKWIVSKILIALDLTTQTVVHAIKKGANLIVLHHPFIFAPTLKENLVLAPYKKNLLKLLKKHKIAIYAVHTAFDKSRFGMVQALKEILLYDQPQKIKNVSYGQKFLVDQPFFELVKDIKEKLKLTNFNTNIIDHNQIITRIAFLPGAAATIDIINSAKDKVDLIVTSEIKWSDWITAKENKINLLEVPHMIENILIPHLANFFQSHFEIEILNLKTPILFKHL